MKFLNRRSGHHGFISDFAATFIVYPKPWAIHLFKNGYNQHDFRAGNLQLVSQPIAAVKGRSKWVWLFILIIGVGCSHLVPPPQDDPLARALWTRFAGANPDLNTFKALGGAKLEMPDTTMGTVNMAGRLALAGALPDKLRIEWLSPLGQPLLRLAADGRSITIVSTGATEIHRLSQTQGALNRLIGIPLGIDSLLAVCAGRLPKIQADAAWITDQSESRTLVTLVDRWSHALATFELDPSSRRVASFCLLDADGSVRYRVDWLQWQQSQEYWLPRQVRFSAPGDRQLELSLERYWCQIELPNQLFSEVGPGR